MRRKHLLQLGVVTAAALLTLGTLPAQADQAPDTDAAVDYEQEALDLKLENAWVPPQEALEFGAEPLAWAESAAEDAAAAASCTVSTDAALAMGIAMTWPEVSLGGEAPSPMTLSRYDTQPTLGDPENRAEGLWFHPGIGVFQLDSAGLGQPFTADEAQDVENAANDMVPHVVDAYCTQINNGASEANARSSAWQPWHACSDGACEDVYNRILSDGITTVDIGRWGGGEMRDCSFDGSPAECLYVDPANAEGADWWAAPGGGQSPISAPFYVWRDGDQEVRYWLASDSGASTDVQATRPFDGDARDSLSWTATTGFCDVTEQRGAC